MQSTFLDGQGFLVQIGCTKERHHRSYKHWFLRVLVMGVFSKMKYYTRLFFLALCFTSLYSGVLESVLSKWNQIIYTPSFVYNFARGNSRHQSRWLLDDGIISVMHAVVENTLRISVHIWAYPVYIVTVRHTYLIKYVIWDSRIKISHIHLFMQSFLTQCIIIKIYS